jgi:hypothetical protein
MNLETELKGLDPKVRDFVLRICDAYVRGTVPRVRRGYRDERRDLNKLAKDLEGLRRRCQECACELRAIADRVREVHIPGGSSVPIMYAVGLEKEAFELGQSDFFLPHVACSSSVTKIGPRNST